MNTDQPFDTDRCYSVRWSAHRGGCLQGSVALACSLASLVISAPSHALEGPAADPVPIEVAPSAAIAPATKRTSTPASDKPPTEAAQTPTESSTPDTSDVGAAPAASAAVQPTESDASTATVNTTAQVVAEPQPAAPVESTARAPERAPVQAQENSVGLPLDETGRRHDGFYMRLAIGGGSLGTSLRGGGSDFDINGPSLGLDFMFGGTPIPGFVIGGAYFFNQAPSPTVEDQGSSGTLAADLNFGVIGVFVDVFPYVSGGFHAGGILGPAVATLSSIDGGTLSSATGWGGGGLIGYDLWVGDEWSLGGYLRAIAGSVSSDADETLKPVSVALLVSGLYH